MWDGDGACDTPIDFKTRDGLDPGLRIHSFGEDANGELYVVTSRGVLRIDAQ